MTASVLASVPSQSCGPRTASPPARWRSSVVEDVSLAVALLVAAELEIVLDGLGADCVALAVLATLPLALRRRLPIVSFVCVAVLTPTLDRALGTPLGTERERARVPRPRRVVLGRRSSPAASVAAGGGRRGRVAGGAGRDLGRRGRTTSSSCCCSACRGSRVAACARTAHQAARLRELATRLEASRAISERVAVARERQRMAHETHDVIAHAVGEMVLQASGAEEVLRARPAACLDGARRCAARPAARPSTSCVRCWASCAQAMGRRCQSAPTRWSAYVAAAPRARFSLALLDAGAGARAARAGHRLRARRRCGRGTAHARAAPSATRSPRRRGAPAATARWHWLSPRWPTPAKRCSSTATRDRRRRSVPCSSRRIRQQRTRVAAVRSPRHASRSARRPRSPS